MALHRTPTDLNKFTLLGRLRSRITRMGAEKALVEANDLLHKVEKRIDWLHQNGKTPETLADLGMPEIKKYLV